MKSYLSSTAMLVQPSHLPLSHNNYAGFLADHISRTFLMLANDNFTKTNYKVIVTNTVLTSP